MTDSPFIYIRQLSDGSDAETAARAVASIAAQRGVELCNTGYEQTAAHLTLLKPGAFFCLWPDSLICHPDRLARQAAATSPGCPSYLSSGMYWFPDSKEVFGYELDIRGRPLDTRIIWTSLVCAVEDTRNLALNDAEKFAKQVFKKTGSLPKDRAVGEFWWLMQQVNVTDLGQYQRKRALVAEGEDSRGFTRSWLTSRRALLQKFLPAYNLPADTLLCGMDGIAYGVDCGDQQPHAA